MSIPTTTPLGGHHSKGKISHKCLPWLRAVVATLIVFALQTTAALAEESLPPHHLVGHEELGLLDRVQELIDDWDPRKLDNPLVVTSHSKNAEGKLVIRKQLRRSDLTPFIADIEAAEVLGKAFFWEMQAGSDFRRTPDGQFVGTACATCHYRYGADARNRYVRRLPYVVWDKYQRHPAQPLEFDSEQPYDVAAEAVKEFKPADFPGRSPWHLIVGSAGVENRNFSKLNPAAPGAGAWESEISIPRPLTKYRHRPEWSMFIDGNYGNAGGFLTLPAAGRRDFRQITTRNSPTVFNAVFSDRLFHDGRAESTFNGFSIFGDADKREVIHRRRVTQVVDADGKIVKDLVDIVPVHIALTRAALASQAVGPIVNEVEMSYFGRQFPNLAKKLLGTKVLGYQTIDADDSLLKDWDVGKTGKLKYEDLIQRAFRREWWDEAGVEKPGTVPLRLLEDDCEPASTPTGSLMEANFSLYWGLSVMLYQATLVSNESPFDDMMRGRTEQVEAKWKVVQNGTGPDHQLEPIKRDQFGNDPPKHQTGTAVFQHGFRIFMNRGCIDCHSGPLFSELYERHPEDAKFGIHAELERTLLPNSRSDAYKVKLRTFQEELLEDLRQEVRAANPAWDTRANKMALELELLREAGHGVKFLLRSEAYLYFRLAGLTEAVARRHGNRVGDLLFDYEKNLVTHLGNRPFFTEQQRVDLATEIVEPVLVEKMPIPPNLLHTRSRLPYRDRHPADANDDDEGEVGGGYAFYDLAFYNLGVAPPRYDRGIGDRRGANLDLSDLLRRTAAALASEEETLENRLTAVGMRGALKALPAEQRSNLTTSQDLKQLAAAAIDIIKQDSEYKNLPEAAKTGLTTQQIEQTINSKAQELRAIADSETATRPTSAPGSAYEFKSKYARPRAAQRTPDQKQPPAAPPGGGRTSSDGPLCDLDGNPKNRFYDSSWDRIDLPSGNIISPRDVIYTSWRADSYFLSRARRLVFEEVPWGFRKPFTHDNELEFWGAFKTPTLRNVELTAPYMHNGRLFTLTDVVKFYAERDRQIPHDRLLNPDKHPEIRGFKLNQDDQRALVFFLLCLTDERVHHEKGPFDHPSLIVVNGYNSVSPVQERLINIDAVGKAGRQPTAGYYFPSNR